MNNKQRIEKEVVKWSDALVKKGMVIPEANKKSIATICCWLLSVYQKAALRKAVNSEENVALLKSYLSILNSK